MPNAHFYLHHHPRQEVLAKILTAKLIDEGGGSPFHRSTILVRNQGMATWIKQCLAKQTGIAMQLDFPQPNRFLSSLMDTTPIPPEHLLWDIYHELDQAPFIRKHPSLAHYLKSDSDPIQTAVKRYQLSSKVAALFDKYLLYRPDWIQQWQSGNTLGISPQEAWQQELWARIHSHFPTHWSQHILHNDTLPSDAPLPSALHIFGISNFAPIYVRFLYLLSQQIPVHLYWLNPVDGYWGDGPDKKQWLLEKAFEELNHGDLHHPLLASFGRMGREFVHTLYGGDKAEHHIQEQDLPADPELLPSTQLQGIQHSIRSNIPNTFDLENDGSVSIHSCHSPVREIECLKDYLLRRSESETLDAGDVLVLCPDIVAYTPAIEAIMPHHATDSIPALPFRICDQQSPADFPTLRALLNLLGMNTTRFTNNEALNILRTPATLSKFGIAESDLETIEHWIGEAGIRWGLDQRHVDSVMESPCPVTWHWQAGLDRLLLGSMMSAQSSEEKLWRSMLPYHHIEGSQTTLLASLCSFVQTVQSLRSTLEESHSIQQWVDHTRGWIEQFFNDDTSTQSELTPLLHCLDELQQLDSDSPIPAEVYRQHLQQLLGGSMPPFGFLSGAITFCEMKPMRAIPAKVICLLGMNHDSFPRIDSDLHFDLTKSARRPADRSSRDDDSYFFLETLMCARDALFISYVGQSIKDGSSLPPSTAVQTLIDHTPNLSATVQTQKLHNFDPAYFRLPTPTSYDPELLESASASRLASIPPTALHYPTDPLELPLTMELHDLLNLFLKPCQFFIKQRLHAQQAFQKSPLKPDEPLSLEPLELWSIKQHVLQHRSLRPSLTLEWEQQGIIPTGNFGRQTLAPHLKGFSAIIEELPQLELRPILVTVGPITITGNLPCLAEHADYQPVHITPSTNKAKDKITTRIYQLLASHHNQCPTPAQLIEIGKAKKGQPIGIINHWLTADPHYESAWSSWIELVELAHHQPLAHFPETSSSYWKPSTKEKSVTDRFNDAKKTWLGNNRVKGECEDANIRLFFDQSALESEAFLSIGETIWTDINELISTH